MRESFAKIAIFIKSLPAKMFYRDSLYNKINEISHTLTKNKISRMQSNITLVAMHCITTLMGHLCMTKELVINFLVITSEI